MRIVDGVRRRLAAQIKPRVSRDTWRRIERLHPEWYRGAVGGKWKEVGALQFEFLKSHGLTPSSDVIDVACGSLRGGHHLVRYLEPGHYVGIDHDPRLLEAGQRLLREEGLADKGATLVELDNFQLGRLGRAFDLGISVSLFTHLTINTIARCLVELQHVMKPGGRFYATFFETDGIRFDPQAHVRHKGPRSEVVTTMDGDPFHYSYDTFQFIVEKMTLDVEYVGDWGHPRDQKMLCFTKRG